MNRYVTTHTDRGYEVHLEYRPGDVTLCGHDVAGDDTLHLSPPVFHTRRKRVTCSECLHLIQTVTEHLKRTVTV